MSEQSSESNQVAQTRADLQHLAASLRDADHLEPDTQQALANLLEELITELDSSSLATVKTAESVRAVVRSLHEQHPPEAMVSAKDRLKESADELDKSEITRGVVYRLLDLLAGMGI